MFDFIVQNLANILICAVLLAVVVLIIVKLRRDKKKNPHGCGYGCEGCPHANECHTQKH